jgi:hypothetical protein
MPIWGCELQEVLSNLFLKLKRIVLVGTRLIFFSFIRNQCDAPLKECYLS